MAPVQGVHFVGSSSLESAEATFQQCMTAMPGRLKRIPDGECGIRHYFTLWQAAFFSVVPEMMTEFKDNMAVAAKDYTPQQVEEGIEKLKKASPETGYDAAAVESYEVFKQMRKEGIIPPGVKFQVCVPGMGSVIGPFVQRDFQAAVEPVYEEALLRAVRNIQNQIPHEDLAIQIDLAAETMFWEDLDLYRPWFFGGQDELDKRKAYIMEYLLRLVAKVEQNVELGIHNCYGDMGHQHWMEPSDLAVVAERGLQLFEKSPHPINFFHMPVPVSAMDKLDAFYEPLKAMLPKFEAHSTDVYLGVVQPNDIGGTQRRIEAAKKAFGDFTFGVGTGCGWGRTPPKEIESILKVSTEVSAPVL